MESTPDLISKIICTLTMSESTVTNCDGVTNAQMHQWMDMQIQAWMDTCRYRHVWTHVDTGMGGHM